MRNLGKDKAKNDWLLYIDADEIVTLSLAAEIALISNKHYSAYQLIRRNYYFDTVWPYQDKIIRLMRKDSLAGWHGPVHETPEIVGQIGVLKNPLLHYTHDDFVRMVEKTNAWSEIEAELLFKSHHPPVVFWRFSRVMLTSFWNSYINQKGYSTGSVGLIESIYQAFSIFVTYAKLWEKQNEKRKS